MNHFVKPKMSSYSRAQFGVTCQMIWHDKSMKKSVQSITCQNDMTWLVKSYVNKNVSNVYK